ncbi:MAG TPA: carboxymuconolactone decarboxylase family protein [Acidimicrobiales bacterium]|jgi:AhpD family alkylhydroperoxidase|nr:carboxymuconolactone decarboxylase family protein [Acidimicrobiales bacterium]
MTPRLNNVASLLPAAGEGIQGIIKAAYSAGVDRSVMELVHLRASQINGCSPCVYSGSLQAKKNGESDERLFAVAAWRETELFTDAERAALALAECMTRLADQADPVPDAVWKAAAEHFDEKQLAGIVLWVATSNLFNRLNATTKQVAGAAW